MHIHEIRFFFSPFLKKYPFQGNYGLLRNYFEWKIHLQKELKKGMFTPFLLLSTKLLHGKAPFTQWRTTHRKVIFVTIDTIFLSYILCVTAPLFLHQSNLIAHFSTYCRVHDHRGR